MMFAIAAFGVAAALAVGLVLVNRGGDAPTYVAALAPLAGGDDARIEASVSDGRVVLDGSNVPVLDAGHTYQLWMLDEDSQVRSAGLFVPSEDGTVAATLDVELDDAQALAVTVEPSGGSPQATTDPIYYGEFG